MGGIIDFALTLLGSLLNKAAIHPTREQKSSAFTRAGFTKGELSQQVPRGVAGRQA